MRSIAVVGAGQAGIVLSAALARGGWRVTLCSDLSADDVHRRMLAPLTSHQRAVLLAASRDPVIGERVWEGFNDPASLFPWFFDASAAWDYLGTRGVGRWDVLRYKAAVARKVLARRVFRRPAPA